jgi:CheY-like chemotaxis protein
VRADTHQIEQVVMNLAINARDAMRGGGTLTIETENVELDEAYARTHPGVAPGPYVMLAVTDTGSGMTPDVQAHLFEPFFTTKEKGTGFGLATAYGIVTQSGGHIWVYSEPGRGSAFKIYLPRVQPDDAPVTSKPASAEPPGGTETILLVEDEPFVCELARDVLEQHGYNVLVARNGREALAVAQSHGGRDLQLVLTDVVMPGMNGRELVRHLRWSRPAARVVFMSGYTDHTALERDVAEYWTSFLQKPFTPSRLLEAVRKALDTQTL